MVKTLYSFNFDVLGDINKWFAQVLALNTIYLHTYQAVVERSKNAKLSQEFCTR
jgi:hypothetical protein